MTAPTKATPKSHRPLGTAALEKRLAVVPDTRLADDDRRTRDRVLLVLLVAAAVGAIVLTLVLLRDGEQAVAERDVALGTSLDLATQVQQACERGELTGRLCVQADDVVADPIPGLPGVDGLPGAPGRDGTDGADGADGRDGRDGQSPACLQSPAQCQGEDGADGASGTSGVDGTDGRDGTDGTDGLDGAPGPRPISAQFVTTGAGCLYRTRYDDGLVVDAAVPASFCGQDTGTPTAAPLPSSLGLLRSR